MTPKDLMSKKVRDEFLIMVRYDQELGIDLAIAEVVLDAFDLPVECITHYYSKSEDDIQEIGRHKYPKSSMDILLLKVPKMHERAFHILNEYGITNLWNEDK